jgi:hypothetical protein
MIKAKLGDILTKRSGNGPAKIRLVGVSGSKFVAQDIDFASPFLISPNDLRTNYGADGTDVPVISDAQAWRDLHNSDPKWLDKSVNAANAAAKAQAKAAEPPEQKLLREAAEQAAD